MAGAEFKITDAIDPEITKKLHEINEELIAANKNLSSFVVKAAQKITLKVDNIGDLERKQQLFSTAIAEANKEQERMMTLQNQARGIYQQVADKLSTLVKSVDGLSAKINADTQSFIKHTAAIRAQEQAEKSLIKGKKEAKTTTEQINKALNESAKSASEAASQNRVLRKAVREVDLTQENAAKTIETYNKKIEENEKLIDSTVDKMTARKRNIGNYESALTGLEEKLKSVLGLNNEFGESILSLAKNQKKGFIQGAKESIFGFGSAIGSLLKNRAFLALSGIAGVGVGFKWWYDYNKGVKEATKLTKQFTGAQGEELKAIRNEVQTIADYYNKDFVEILRSVNSLSKQFGISQSEALDLVKDGFIAGADANGQYLDILKEYPAYFKEAGISAEGFISIIAQSAQEGVFSDKAVDAIKEANIRLREMTDSTAAALDGIGISSQQVQKELQSGATTTFEIMQKVSAKLDELPESSSAVGTAIADIFGGPGEDAGLQYIRMLKDVKFNLDEAKKAAGRLGEAEEELLASQTRLSNEIAALFDLTGGSFETLEAKVKSFVNDTLSGFIKMVRSAKDDFTTLFSSQTELDLKSKVQAQTRGKGFFGEEEIAKEKAAIESLAQTAIKAGKSTEEAYKEAKEKRIEQLKEQINNYKLLEDKFFKERNTLSSKKDNAARFFGLYIYAADEVKQYKKELDDVNMKWETAISLQSKAEETLNYVSSYDNIDSKKKSSYIPSEKEKEYVKKINEELSALSIEGIKNRYERERAEMKAEHDKKMAEITGNTEKEIKLRKELDAKLERDTANSRAKESLEVERVNLENRLAAAEEGSQEELAARLALLENQKKMEIAEAAETGASVLAIEKKFQKESDRLLEEEAAKQADAIGNEYAMKDLLGAEDVSTQIKKLTQAYAEGKMKKEEYEAAVLKIQQDYALKSAQAAVESVEEQLKVQNLSDEDRARLEEELHRAKIALSDEETRIILENDEKQRKSIQDKQRAIEDYLSRASEILNGLSALGNALFEREIQQIEEEQEANEDAGEKELERIEQLEESGVLTKEEAEARKRAAEAKTEAKSEELERKKAALQRKQAIWDKANSLAQVGISTAQAIMKTLAEMGWVAGAPFVALTAAMGAIQAATIIATPIPKYAKGTDYHKGGLALVGDGGEHELVQTGHGAWLTPDIPTLVDLPRGASVIPNVDIDRIINDNLFLDVDKYQREAQEQGIVVLSDKNDYDYGRLEAKIDRLAKVMEKGFKSNEKQLKDAAYREYIRSKM